MFVFQHAPRSGNHFAYINCPLKDNLFPTKDRRGHMLKQTRIVGFLKLVTVMTVNTLLIVPVMLLYFGNLSQVHSCLVVVSFTFLFTGVVSTRKDISPYATFMASAAFVAVLSTFLAQLQIYTAN
ncbi:hypothetical protein GQ53DRAFT_438839 [Thozetella sp. PMI_491]|nr:hypothetical protein GQ53DRAFT_438839 [Thozetella sp. PMI_491]